MHTEVNSLRAGAIFCTSLAQNQELCGISLIVIYFLSCNNIRKVQNMVISCDKGYFCG